MEGKSNNGYSTVSTRNLATAPWPTFPGSVLPVTAERSSRKFYRTRQSISNAKKQFESEEMMRIGTRKRLDCRNRKNMADEIVFTASPRMTPRSPSTLPPPWATRPV